MKKILLDVFLVCIFISLALGFYNFKLLSEIDKIFVTLSTFLFSVFIGFFISKQSGRYSEIRKLISDFDGTLSSIYRGMENFGEVYHAKTGAIIRRHYEMVKAAGWDYHFVSKTSTITDLQRLTATAVSENGSDGIKGVVLTRNMLGIQELQKIRKNMISLREERIPVFQWLLIVMIAVILITTVSTITSEGFVLISLVKSAFVSSVLVALILLKQLDSLELFSGKIGQYSAEDVINIIDDKK